MLLSSSQRNQTNLSETEPKRNGTKLNQTKPNQTKRNGTKRGGRKRKNRNGTKRHRTETRRIMNGRRVVAVVLGPVVKCGCGSRWLVNCRTLVLSTCSCPPVHALPNAPTHPRTQRTRLINAVDRSTDPPCTSSNDAARKMTTMYCIVMTSSRTKMRHVVTSRDVTRGTRRTRWCTGRWSTGSPSATTTRWRRC